MGSAAYQRELRAKAAAAGLCSKCKIRWPRPGLKTCEVCAGVDDRTNANQAFYRECCQSTDEHRFDCREVPRCDRGAGPFIARARPTAAELTAAMRAA